MSVKAPTLFDSTIERAFIEFHQANPIVYSTLVRLAREARQAGATKIGVRALWERMRWDLTVTTRDHGDFKLNDHFTSRYVRMIVADNPDLCGLFETRQLRAA